MFLAGYFLQATAGILHVLLMSLLFVVIARAVLSWVSPDPYNPIVRIINQLSEPLLFPIRSRLPFFSGIDFSPILLILAIQFLDSFLVPSLQRMALSLLSN